MRIAIIKRMKKTHYLSSLFGSTLRKGNMYKT